MIEYSTEQQALRDLNKALREEADGKELRKDLGKNMRAALDPLVSDVKSGLMGVGSGSVPTQGEPLRSSVAKKIKAESRMGGKATGARLKAKQIRTRGFAEAPKRLNSKKGWRHPVFGSSTWVNQMGAPGYWDNPIESGRDEHRKAVVEAMDATAARIASNVRTRQAL